MRNPVIFKYEFAIYKVGNGYIIHNRNKDFSKGHSHQKRLNTCISIAKLVHRQQMPRNHSKWFLESIIRVSNNKEYIEKIKDLMLNYKDLMEDSKDIDTRKC